MPARPSELSPSLNEQRTARKKFLLLACACDRVELVLTWRKPARPPNPLLGGLPGIVSGSWFQIARTVVMPFLPRKFRAAGLLYKLWRSHASN